MKIVKQLGKMVGAAIVAVIILSLIISVYSTSPLRVENPQGNTDYVWKPDSLWMNMSEGISFGKMDGKGFNNLEVIEDPDIILLGSSHIESKNVNQHENTAYYLSERVEGRYSAYNMGISGHTIYKVCQYLPKTLSLYQGHVPKYVVIETDDIALTQTGVDEVMNHTVEKTPVYDTGLVATLQKIPAFRLFYHQLDSGMKEMLLPELSKSKREQNQTGAAEQSDRDSTTANAETVRSQPQYDQLMSYLGDLQEQYHTKIIIMFHPFEKFNDDGSISFINNKTSDMFATSAEKHGISFLDMAERFEKMYIEDHRVPHGFITGEISSGHLNKYGHEAIADGIYDTITGLEG